MKAIQRLIFYYSLKVAFVEGVQFPEMNQRSFGDLDHFPPPQESNVDSESEKRITIAIISV
jgi:hypothetical protein